MIGGDHGREENRGRGLLVGPFPLGSISERYHHARRQAPTPAFTIQKNLPPTDAAVCDQPVEDFNAVLHGAGVTLIDP